MLPDLLRETDRVVIPCEVGELHDQLNLVLRRLAIEQFGDQIVAKLIQNAEQIRRKALSMLGFVVRPALVSIVIGVVSSLS